MQKLVVLKLDGDLVEGVRVTLEIGAEGDRAAMEVRGNLPPNPEMVTHYNYWRSIYRSLEDLRITPIAISIGGSPTDHLNNCRKLGDELSKHLNSWLNFESFRPLKEKLLKQLTPDDTVRVLIKTDDIWLRRLPWCLWNFFEDYSKAEVALSALEYEYLPKLKTATSRDKVKILAILGNSEGIVIDKDRELLEKLPDAKTTFLVEPQRSQIAEQLWEQDWDILFFAGHSSSQDDGKTGNIYINKTDSLTINELRYALKRAVRGGLQLAIFNSCDGLGLAHQLEDLHIPQIIIMREPVPDKVAQEFLKSFLTKFSGGSPLYLAVRESRERLHSLEDEYPCAIWLPVICQNPAAVPPTWEDLLQPKPETDDPQLLRHKTRSDLSYYSGQNGCETFPINNAYYITSPTISQSSRLDKERSVCRGNSMPSSNTDDSCGTTDHSKKTWNLETDKGEGLLHNSGANTHNSQNKNPPSPASFASRVRFVPGKTSFWWRIQTVLLTSMVVTSLVMGVRSLGLLQSWELKTFDQLMGLRPAEKPDPRLLIVTVDEGDIQYQNRMKMNMRWSLSDQALAQLLKKLDQYKPRTIGIDIYRDYPLDRNQASLATRMQGDDGLFAICKVRDREANNLGISPPPEVPTERQGFSDVVKDPDGTLRRHLLAMEPDPTSPCTTPYALSAQVAFHYLEAEGISAKYTQTGDLQVGNVVFKRLPTPRGSEQKNFVLQYLQARRGSYQQVDTWGYQILLNYRSYRSLLEIAPKVTLTEVLTGQINSNIVKDRIVLIGVTATSAGDFLSTPYTQEMPGVIVQAQMVSQILSTVKDGRPLLSVWPFWGEALWVWGWSMVGGILVWRWRSQPHLALAGGAALGVLYVLCFSLLIQGSWIPLVPSALALVFTGGSVRSTLRPNN